MISPHSNDIRDAAKLLSLTRNTERRGKPVDPCSTAQRIQALAVGECISEVRKIDPNMTIDGVAQSGVKLKQQFRSAVGSSLTLASARTGATYETEASYMMTPGSALYLVLIITRTA